MTSSVVLFQKSPVLLTFWLKAFMAAASVIMPLAGAGSGAVTLKS